MKRLVLFSIIFFVAIISANPLLYFINPTPADGSTISNNWAIINVSVLNASTSFIDFNNGLLGYWRMNNETGENSTLLRDWSSYSKNGTILGAVYNSSGGVFGGGFEFDGLNDYINISFMENYLTRGLWKKNSGGEWMHIVEVLNESNITGEEFTHIYDNPGNVRVTSNHAPDNLYEVDSYVIKEEEGKVVSSPIVSGDYVYFGGVNGDFFMINATDLSDPHFIEMYILGGANVSTPAVSGDYVYVAGDIGKVFQFNKTTLDLINSYDVGNVIASSPSIADGYLYIGSNDNKLYQLNSTDLSFVNSYETLGDIVSVANVSGGYVYFGSRDGKVYQLNSTDLSFVNSYETGGEILSSPAVSNGSVYIGSNDNNFYQLNASNISILISNYSTSGAVASNVKFLNNSVYFGNDAGMVYQLNASNVSQKLFNFSTGAKVRNALKIYENILYLSSNNALYRLNVSNISQQIGKTTVTGADGEIAPEVTNTSVYLSFFLNSLSPVMRRYNVSTMAVYTGNSIYFPQMSIRTSPAVADGYIYFGSDLGIVYQLNESTMDLVSYFKTNGGRMFSSPAVSGGYVYIGGTDGYAYQLNASNVSQEIANFSGGDGFSSSPFVLGGYVYIGNHDFNLYQLNSTNISDEIAHYTTGGTVLSSPVVSNGYLYVSSSDFYAYQLNASNVSQMIARFSTTTFASSSPAVFQDYVYFGSYSDYVYQLNASNVSQMIARFLTGGDVASSLTASNGYLYVGSDDSYLYQLNASNVSQEISRYDTGSNVGVGNGAVIAGGYAFFSSYDNYLYQLNASNVSQRISLYKLEGSSAQSYPAVANGYVYVGSYWKKFYKLGEGKTYINGLENSSNYTFPIFKSNNEIRIGKNYSDSYYNGSIDDVIYLNYSLNSEEVQSLYNSSDYPNFSHNFSGLDDGTYYYSVYSQNSTGNTTISTRYFIVDSTVDSASAVDSGVNTGGSKEVIYKPTREQTIAGYSKLLTEGNKVEISEEGSVSVIEVIDVDYDNSRVSFSFNGEVYNLNNEESVKIDSDSDGYYDLEISVSDIRFNGYANFLFKEIYEEIPSDIQEGTDEGIGGIVNEENRIWIYVLLGIVIVGVAVYFLVKSNGKKRRRKRYGY